MARTLHDRLKFELARNRQELIDVVTPIDDLTYAPAAGMKTYYSQLVEIGAMEAESLALLATGVVPDWKSLEEKVQGTTAAELLASLDVIRGQLFEYLDSIDDEALQEPVEVPQEWAPYFGDPSLEREELFRWLASHEYYHLAQMISYRWIQGFNPYAK